MSEKVRENRQITQSTSEFYVKTATQLSSRWRGENPNANADCLRSFLDWLYCRRLDFCPSTWRTYRSAVTYAARHHFEEIGLADVDDAEFGATLSVLDVAVPRNPVLPPSTSGKKKKRLPQHDLDRLFRFLDERDGHWDDVIADSLTQPF